MILAFLGTISLPKDKNGENEESVRFMYHIIWMAHLVLFGTIIVNHYYADLIGVLRVPLNTVVMMGYVLFIIHISVSWIFPNRKEEQVAEEGSEEAADRNLTVEENSFESVKWGLWMYCEVVIFFGNIFSTVIFIFFRSCSRSRIHIALDGEKADNNTDLLEEQ